MKKAALLLALACAFALNAQAADYTQNRHVKMGVSCEMCHGEKNAVPNPGIDQCKACHNPKEVAEKTKEVKPTNPHVSPHYGNELDCALCHLQHSPTEDYCAECHQFGFKAP